MADKPPVPDRTAEVRALAGIYHEAWRREFHRRNPGGSRPKRTSDATWMAANGGSDTVDIAASGFEELPADWQVENLIAAEQVVGHIEAAEAKGEPLDDGFVERTAALLHAHWVARHGDNAPVALRADFADLPSEEQDKDRVQVRLALQLRSETR